MQQRLVIIKKIYLLILFYYYLGIEKTYFFHNEVKLQCGVR